MTSRLSQEAFGSFTLIYSVLLFANSLQSGLITQPHNILGVTRHGGDYTCYTTSTAVSQLFFGAVAALAVLAAWAVARCAAWSVAPLLLTLAPSIVSWQLQEFVDRLLATAGVRAPKIRWSARRTGICVGDSGATGRAIGAAPAYSCSC